MPCSSEGCWDMHGQTTLSAMSSPAQFMTSQFLRSLWGHIRLLLLTDPGGRVGVGVLVVLPYSVFLFDFCLVASTASCVTTKQSHVSSPSLN